MAQANLAVQVLLAVLLACAILFARRRQFTRHCWLVRIGIGVQLLSIAILMAPSLASFVRNPPHIPLLYFELLVHHSLGLLLLASFIYINLAFAGIVRGPRRYLTLMRATATVWGLALILGVLLFLRLYV